MSYKSEILFEKTKKRLFPAGEKKPIENYYDRN